MTEHTRGRVCHMIRIEIDNLMEVEDGVADI